jgi:hypothetical protein
MLPTFSIFQKGDVGTAEEVHLSRRLISEVKHGRIQFLDEYLNANIAVLKPTLGEFITPNSTLIPIPRSAPLLSLDSVWPSLNICQALLQNGFGREIITPLVRVSTVRKAAYCRSSDERPTVSTHYQSMNCNLNGMLVGILTEIVLVDDVITQGRTSYASYLRVAQSLGSEIPIKIFACFRSNTFGQIDNCFYPQQGILHYYDASDKTFHQIDN